MLIYVAVLTNFVISLVSHQSCRIIRFLLFFYRPVITFFPLTYVGIAIVSTILFFTFCIT
jgi:hypothetical protein